MSRHGIVRGAHQIVIATFINLAGMYARSLSMKASYSRDGMFEEINNIVLVGRASKYARGKSSETS